MLSALLLKPAQLEEVDLLMLENASASEAVLVGIVLSFMPMTLYIAIDISAARLLQALG